ncbi:MAG: 2Fe-2S iron-sulfur cluster-binding protein [Chitinophagales bacterium]
MSKFHSLKIKDIKKETKDAVSISFDIPENLQSDYAYLPGQYVTLKVNVNGLTFNRSYSLCSNPYEGKEHRIAIKRVPGGKVSTYLTQMAVPGEMIEVMLPMGNFHTDLNKDAEKHYYLFGAGSGITPLFSILKAVLSDEPKSKVTLVYGNYNSDAVIFKDELNVLASTHSDRFNLIHVFDKPEKKGGFLGFGKKVVEELAFEEGQINQARVRKVLLGQNLVAAEFYTCGPTGMMKAVESALTELNIDKEKINVEYFTEKEDEDKVAINVGEAEENYDGNTEISVRCDGSDYSFSMKGKETILDASSKNNVDPPFACMVGACTTCRCKLNEGSVEMGDCEALTPREIEQGYILSCQAKPTSSIVSVDFDA